MADIITWLVGGGAALGFVWLLISRYFGMKHTAARLESERDAEKGRADRIDDAAVRIEDRVEAEHEIAVDVIKQIEARDRDDTPPPVASPQHYAKSVRTKLNRLRMQSATPAVDLGRKLGKPWSWVVEVEVGGKDPSVADVMAWAAACGASLTTLTELELESAKAGWK